jgi:DDE_Tnp_1-associated/Transposase DDE domain
MDASTEGSLLTFLASVPDPRSRHGQQHPLSAIRALVCCAVLCGAKSYAAIGQWAHDQDLPLMHRLGFTRRPPKSGGIRKVLLALDRTAFEHALSRWAEAVLGRPLAAAAPLPQAFALDGKTARGSFDDFQKAVHLLSLLAHESGLTLAQAAVPNGAEEKTNEHKAALRLLEGLVLRGRLITGDAMFCQRDFCQQVVDAGGDYLVFVKENQPTLLHDIEATFAPAAAGAFSPSAATDLGSCHGYGDDAGQGARAGRASQLEGDDGVERVPGLARCGPSRTGPKRGHQGRQGLARDALLHHRCLPVGGRRRPVTQVGPGALVGGEPFALRP